MIIISESTFKETFVLYSVTLKPDRQIFVNIENVTKKISIPDGWIQ